MHKAFRRDQSDLFFKLRFAILYVERVGVTNRREEK